MGRKLKDLRGHTFDRLTAIEPAVKDKNGWKWRCQCECGNEVLVYGWQFGTIHSCGCLAREKSAERKRTHGRSKTRLMPIWLSMKQRCLNPHSRAYKNYGARGITVCDEWLNSFEAFEKWAIENGYDENALRGECTLDRIDNNGNYEPSNCRWIAMSKQQRNKRTNRLITYKNETLSIAEWSRKLGIPYATIRGRLNAGKRMDEVLSTSRVKYRWQDK